jgi:hypothetical protein
MKVTLKPMIFLRFSFKKRAAANIRARRAGAQTLAFALDP